VHFPKAFRVFLFRFSSPFPRFSLTAMPWTPTFDGDDLPVLGTLPMLERLEVKPSSATDPEWLSALSNPTFAGASNGPEIYESILFLWRLKSMEKESSGKSLWKKYVAAGIVRIGFLFFFIDF
jgi:hypothetical protein